MSDISSLEILYKATISQYSNDAMGKQMWPNLDIKSADTASVMRSIFMHGACIDFANAISDLTNWPIYEIQWGDSFLDGHDDCELLKGIHRVIQHPSGRYFDVTGWTDMETVLKTFNAHDLSYKWMGEVDYGARVFNVDYELIKKSALSLVPEDCVMANELAVDSKQSGLEPEDESTFSMGM